MILILIAVLANPCGPNLVSFSWPVVSAAEITFECADQIFGSGFE